MKLGLIGHGRMGLEIEQVAEQRGHAVAAVFEVDRPFRRDAELAGAEVLIDFSLPDGVPATLRSAAARAVPIVEGTTGWYQHLPELSALPGLTMIYSPNFSIGVYRFTRLVEAAARLFGPDGDYDCYVHEWHHRGKADSPSGTARNLAEVVLQATPHKERLQGEACHRPIEPDELHVTSTRAGRIPGTHEVGFDSEVDQVTLRHQAFGRAGFALGAVQAAEWLLGRQGVYTMDDFMKDQGRRRSS